MKLSLFVALFILLNIVIIKSQKVPSIPWPPQVTYNGTQSNWTQVAPTNYLPPREYQSVVYDYKNNRVIIFGGRNANGTFLNDVWSWSFVANRFIQIFPGGAAITARSDHIAGVDVAGQKMFVFGGKNSKGTLGDFWYLSLVSGSEKWIQVCSKKNNTEPCNNLPSERWGGFGGSWAGPNYGNHFFVSHGKSGFQAVKSDTWVFNFQTFVWKQITGEDGEQGRFVIGYSQKSPSPRFGAAATMLGPLSLSIYGGCGAGGYGACPSQDGWLMNYNLTSDKAEWLSFPGCPIRSYNGQAVPIPGTNQTASNRYSQPMFFGGYGGTIGGRYHSENIFEIYDTSSSLTGSARWSRTFLLDLRNNPLKTPGGRTGASMVLIHPYGLTSQNSDFLIFFGGRDRHSTVRSDMWYLQGQSLLGRRFKCTANINFRMIHGILMFIAFGGIFPITMMLARFGKDGFLPRLREKSPWLWVHSIANIVGCLITIPALVLAIVAVNTAHWTSIPHAYLGIIAFAFVMFNPIWGAIRPDKEASSRAGWAYVHLWIGRLAILLGFTNMMLGILMIRAHIVIFALYIVYLALYFVLFITLFLLQMKKSGDTCGKALNPKYHSDKYDY
eukprot:TRINITY_DN1586_c0_g1_i1.p1 TRINITY_DN1586_c0_g1~~TRINITY_DN1586_c0_g1_i1.p1  ORF type:complete len:611 (+),score=140.42 TRINITY_DN1586_c0_g1_i1:54-1886(+)